MDAAGVNRGEGAGREVSKNPPRPLIKTLPDRLMKRHTPSPIKAGKRGPPSIRCLGGGAAVNSRFHLRGSEVEP